MGDVTQSVAAPPPASGAQPYGIVGLLVSSLVILALAALLASLMAVLAMAVVAAGLGWHPMLERLVALRETIVDSDAALLRAGVLFSLVVYAAVSLSVLLAARFRGGRQWRDLVAWHPWHPFRGTRLFWGVAVAGIVYNLAAGALISRYYPPSKDWVTLPSGPVWAAAFVVLAVLMAPLTEELVFRGWLYTGLRRTIGVTAGILVTSALFAAAHWEKTHLYALAVFPVGLALGLFRERTGSLLASMTFHAVYNGAALAVLGLG